MIVTNQKIILDISNSNNAISIVAKQKDYNSRFLDVALVGNGKKIDIMPTSTVVINARRKDGQAKAFGGVVNADGTATVPLTYWMLELGGSLYCDVSIVDAEGRKLTSTQFVVEVERATYDGDDITEDENYDILVKLIEDVSKFTPDQNYNPESENPQSGKAVAEAVNGVVIGTDNIAYNAVTVDKVPKNFGYDLFKFSTSDDIEIAVVQLPNRKQSIVTAVLVNKLTEYKEGATDTELYSAKVINEMIGGIENGSY